MPRPSYHTHIVSAGPTQSALCSRPPSAHAPGFVAVPVAEVNSHVTERAGVDDT